LVVKHLAEYEPAYACPLSRATVEPVPLVSVSINHPLVVSNGSMSPALGLGLTELEGDNERLAELDTLGLTLALGDNERDALGLTLGLTLGLVLTETEGEALGETDELPPGGVLGLGLALGDNDGDTERETDGLTLAEGDRLRLALRLTLADGDRLREGLGLTLGLTDELGLALALGLKLALALPPTVPATDTAHIEFAIPDPVKSTVIVVVPATPAFEPTTP
jgi:hypothetical protein